jgi:hypothetical protein
MNTSDTSSTAVALKFLPNLGQAMRRALQWRLLLWWLVLMLIPTLVMLLPMWQLLSAQFDHTLHAADWAQRWDFVMLGDLVGVINAQQGLLAAAGNTSALLLVILIPLLNGLFIAASRSPKPLGMGEMLREGLRHYWRMLRLMIFGLIPIAIGLVVFRLLNKGVSNYAEHATLASQVDHWKWAATTVGVIVFAIANASVDAARASLALEPARRSAFLAWWRGLKLVLRHPLRSAVLYLGVTAIAAIALAILFILRFHLGSATFFGLVLGLLIAQILTVIVAWMHYARQFGMLELTRALKGLPAA